MIKAHNGNFLYDSMEYQQAPLRNVQQQVTSSLSEVEIDSLSDVDRVVGSSPSSLSNKSLPETTDFIPEPRTETLPPSKFGRKRARIGERQVC